MLIVERAEVIPSPKFDRPGKTLRILLLIISVLRLADYKRRISEPEIGSRGVFDLV
jgi:hypothetical protein